MMRNLLELFDFEDEVEDENEDENENEVEDDMSKSEIRDPKSKIERLFKNTHIPHPLTQNFRFIVNQGDDT